MHDLPALTLVLGGAASGKSDFAEQIVIAAGQARTYIATAQAFDNEMSAKITKHRAARTDDGWVTIEEPTNLADVLSALPGNQVALIDCATLWLSNISMSSPDISAETDALLAALETTKCSVVIVTNETGYGIVPENRIARNFRQQQGMLNQRLAAQAELVVQVIAGLPQVLKGKLPERSA